MDIFFNTNRYYRINRSFLSIIGLWPYNDPKDNKIRRIFAHIGFTLIILSQIFSLVTSDLSLTSITDVLVSFIPSLCVVISYTNVYCRGKMGMMLEHIRFDWYNFNDGVEREIIENYANRSKMCTIFAIVMIITTTSIHVLPVTCIYLYDLVIPLNESRVYELPFKAELFIDHQKHFFLLLIVIYMLSLFIMVCIVASYTLLMLYTLHACGMLAVVGYMLKHAFDTEKYNVFTTKDSENVTTKIIRCVFYHTRTTRFIGKINSLYKTGILLHVLLAFIMVSLAFLRVFYLENIAENMKEFLVALIHIISLFFWSFTYTLIGQVMLNKSMNILENAYDASWYLAPYKIQKLLLMIMMKSMRYSTLNIGGIYVGSFNFFASMMQNALSYALVLQSLR